MARRPQSDRTVRDPDVAEARRALAAAELALARVHGFERWPAFSAHLDGLADAASPVSHFEAAAEAIVRGGAAALSGPAWRGYGVNRTLCQRAGAS
jgi:hypothetical protein